MCNLIFQLCLKFNKFETDYMQFTDRKIIWSLIFLQVIVCLPFITQFPIGLDEPFSIFYAQQNLTEFLPEINKGNNSPLHFILLHYWIKLFGISPLAVRSLSLLFSLLTIPALYKLAKSGSENKYAIFVSLIFVFSRFNHFHAMEARMYSLFVLLFVWIIHDIYQIIFHDKSRFFSLIILNVLLLYTHYLGVFVVLTELILVVIYFNRLKPQLKKNWVNGFLYYRFVFTWLDGTN